MNISEETTGVIIYQKMGRYAKCHVSNTSEQHHFVFNEKVLLLFDWAIQKY